MIVDNIEIVTILTILLFGIPLIISAIRSDILKKLSVARMTKTINRALAMQIVIGLALILSSTIVR